MSMLEFVRRAFGEGGAQLEILSNLLDCKEIGADTTTEEKLHLALAEVLRLRTQLQNLQQQVNHVIQDRERMNLLIWTELSRLGSKIEGHSGYETPIRTALMEDGATKGDPILRAILGASGLPTSSTDTPRDLSPIGGLHQPQPSDSLLPSSTTLPPLRAAKRHRSQLEDGGASPRHSEEEWDPNSRGRSSDTPSEQRFLIESWMTRQRNGFTKAGGIGEAWSLNGSWHCYVCNNDSKDPPGDHFCVGKYDPTHRDGLKVYCQYCRKGTGRMPDLRVHFKKIVYCRVLREELKRTLMALAQTPQQQQQQASVAPPTSPSSSSSSHKSSSFVGNSPKSGPHMSEDDEEDILGDNPVEAGMQIKTDEEETRID